MLIIRRLQNVLWDLVNKWDCYLLRGGRGVLEAMALRQPRLTDGCIQRIIQCSERVHSTSS